MKRINFCISFIFVFCGPPIAAEVIIVGGENGRSWQSGGGELPAQVIRSDQSIESTNAPGGVIAFSPAGFDNWIFPQRADTTLNIALGANSAARGGSITSPNIQNIRGELPKIIDDDGITGMDLRLSVGASSARVLGLIIDLDLGARFGLDRFRFFPRNAAPEFPAPEFPFQNDFMRSFEIFINDGTPETKLEGVPIRESVALVGQNEDQVVDIRIPPQYVRFVRLKSLTATGFDMAEFQVFGTGFVPEAVYVSNIFDFGDLALLGKLRWVQEQVGDGQLSRITVRTRTGEDPGTVQFNKVRPGERIFRIGGGNAALDPAGAGGRGLGGISQNNDEVPWKFARDVEDEELKALVEGVLDNETVALRDAIQTFNALSLEEQNLLALSEADYKKLSSGDRGAIRNDVDNWSEWSPPYALDETALLTQEGSGVEIVSPGPKRYLQFMIEFFSDEFESASGVGGLAFDVLASPFAEQLMAEIVPRRASVGERTDFTYAVLAKFRSGQDRGFNRLQVDTPLRVQTVGAMRIRRPDGTVLEADFTGVALDRLPVQQGDFSIVEIEEQSAVFEFPLVDEDGTELQVVFDNSVLRFGTTFSGRAFNTENGELLGQGVVAGNAANLGDGDSDVQPLGTPFEGNLSVEVPISGDLLVNVVAGPRVFTPNGDGVNDLTMIQYDLTNVGSLTGLAIAIYDLAGRPVRRLYDDLDSSGRFARAWDGRDDAGQVVPPGNYVFSVTLAAKTGQRKVLAAVGVAY
jgi:hypothetical protein